MTSPSMFVVDDDAEMGALTRDVAELAGFSAEAVTNARKLFEIEPEAMPDVIVMDLVMPDMEGMELLCALSKRGCRSKIIIMSGYQSSYLSSAELLASGLGLETVGIIPKPVSLETLENHFKQAQRAIREGAPTQ